VKPGTWAYSVDGVYVVDHQGIWSGEEQGIGATGDHPGVVGMA
jgi:hypothetical protein